MVSAQVRGRTEAKVGGTADALMSLHETLGAVSGAHVIQEVVTAREYWADDRSFSLNSVLETEFKRSRSGILVSNSCHGVVRGGKAVTGTVVREGKEFSRAVRIMSRRNARKALSVR